MKRIWLWLTLVFFALLAALWWRVGADTAHDIAVPNAVARTVQSESLDALAPSTTPQARSSVTTESSLSNSAENTDATSSSESLRRGFRLIDDSTGEPVPHFVVTCELGPEELTTDANGVLHVDVGPEVEELTLVLTENSRGTADRIQTAREAAEAIASSVRVSASAEANEIVDVRVPVGPTYRLEFASPPGHAASELLVTLRSADPSQMFDSAATSLRDSAAPWVRFRPTARVMQGGPSWRLALETPDGLWYGSALVASNVGVARDAVSIQFEARARLEGRVLDSDGTPIEEGIVRIERDGASFSTPDNRPLLTLVREGGHFRFGAVPPAEYSVLFARKRYHDFRARIALVAGQARAFDIALEKLPSVELGRIEGRVESDTGHFEATLYTYLRPLDTTRAPTSGRVEWKDLEGRRVGAFVFDEVELGDYVVTVSGSGLRAMDPKERSARPGDPPLNFEVRDSGDRVNVDVTVEDETGTPMPKFAVALSIDGPNGELVGRGSGRDGVAVVEGAPLDVRCRYKISAAGRQPIWGEHTIRRDDHSLRFALRPGWGTEVFVRDGSGAPIVGAAVYIDGERAGETDERGELHVARDREPERARVEFLDWQLSPRSGLSDDGRFRAFEPFLNVVLEAPSR